jgi:transposase
LKRCATGDYRTRLAGWCFTQAGQAGDLSLVLYDVTTLRTQAEKEDDLRKVGFSKDRSVEAQIVVGLLVDRAGFPLQIGCFAGNQAEKATITPTIEAYTARNGLGRIVVAADAGMLSAKNLAALDAAGYWFIVGSRMVKAPIDLESHFRWYGDAFTDGQIVDTITPKMGKNIDNDPAKRFEPVWDPDTCPGSWRAVWQFSQKRFAHDNLTLTAQTNRAVQAVNGVKPARRPRFVAMTGKDTYRLDQAAIERARRLAGLKGYVTNMPAPIMQAQELIDHYHDLWHVEQSFRISKSDLQASPFFARKRDAIEAHLTIVFAALAIARTIQNRTGLTIRRVIRVLRPLRSATIRANGITQTIPPITDPDQQALINTLTTTPPRH